MRFKRLEIQNLRAIEKFLVEDLNDFVVIAGQNGSGKSCVFDAIRLLKSLYGGYQANEYLQWFGEFAINMQDRHAVTRVFRNPRQELRVSALLEFTQSEIDYVLSNLEDLASPIAWQTVTGQPIDAFSFSDISFATQYEHLRPQAETTLKQIIDEARESLSNPTQEISFSVTPNGQIALARCIPAQLVFQAYKPDHLGVIEYHGASRIYNRQDVGGINLDPRTFQDQRRQQGLYNWQAKYQNVKTELASSYIRKIIAREAGEETDIDNLDQTLTELFKTFFPDKEYTGARALPDGNLEFPVKLRTGRTHDIDELSSGEKEVLYGYLRLKNSTPKRSILLLDEPELHLNPSLLQGFTDFYYRHLGLAQGNQIWMVTHSDALLRQAVGNSNYRVYHMSPATTNDTGINQASSVFLDSEVERAIIDLVGDLATYQPHSKVIIFEGEGVNGFDVNMVRRLFPDIARRVNLVSGGRKDRVRDLYAFLEDSTNQVGVRNRFFAVTDRDHDAAESERASQFAWDRYHIENYLLDSSVILSVVHSLDRKSKLKSIRDVDHELKECAEDLVDHLSMELLQKEVNHKIISGIDIKGPPAASDYNAALRPSIEASMTRASRAISELTPEELEKMGEKHALRFRDSLENGTWIKDFPGREILKRFVSKHINGVAYEPFVNLILDRLAEQKIQPSGMRVVLEKIMSSND